MAITSSVASMVSQKVYVGVLTKLSPNFSLMDINLLSNGVSTRTSEDIRAIGPFIYYVSNGLSGRISSINGNFAKALTKYERPKMKREAREKTQSFGGISFHFRRFVFH